MDSTDLYNQIALLLCSGELEKRGEETPWFKRAGDKNIIPSRPVLRQMWAGAGGVVATRFARVHVGQIPQSTCFCSCTSKNVTVIGYQ